MFIIRNKDTGKYFTASGDWSGDMNDAYVYMTPPLAEYEEFDPDIEQVDAIVVSMP